MGFLTKYKYKKNEIDEFVSMLSKAIAQQLPEGENSPIIIINNLSIDITNHKQNAKGGGAEINVHTNK